MVSKKKTKKTRRLKGGKYVGEGTYGCGYLPALRCEGEAEREVGVFSKIMDKTEAESEYALANLFHPIDPEQKYFLYPSKICPVNREVLPNPENNLEKCAGKFSEIAEARILQYKNGGESLEKIKLDAGDYLPFFTSLKQLLEGLDKLHDGNVAHMDIKLPNIVYLRDSPESYHLRYIDFGLSLRTNTNNYINDVFESNYFVWPYEIRFLTESFSKNYIDTKDLEDFIEKQRYNISYYPEELYFQLYGNFSVTPQMYKNIWDRLKISNADRKKWGNLLLKATDIYSLGRVLSKLYSKHVGHFYRYSEIYVNDPANPGFVISLNDLQARVLPEVWEWHKNVAENITLPFFTLIKSMMNLDPQARITAKNALVIYTGLMNQFTQYFTENKIKVALGIYFPHLLLSEPLTPISNTSPQARRQNTRRKTRKSRKSN